MDSKINATIIDEEDKDSLHIKYKELFLLMPKSKTDIEEKHQFRKGQKLTYIGSIANTNEWTKSTLNTNTLNQMQPFVKSLNSIQQMEPVENQTKSLSPLKNYYEVASDYTFKLSNSKRVRFRLNSDFQE